jgi:L-iditol 2-dehydrogenase
MVGNASVDMTIKKENYAKILRKQLRLEGSWNSDFSQTVNDWKDSVQAISEKRIEPERLITHAILFERSPQAFDIIKQRDFYNKIMVVM